MTDETIFATALEKADPAERAAFLAEACGDDAERRKRLEGAAAGARPRGRFPRTPGGRRARPGPRCHPAVTGTPVPAWRRHRPPAAKRRSDDEPLTFLAPPTRPDSLGRLGHYEVLQVLGRGGFGIVFRAFDDMLQRVVAVR